MKTILAFDFGTTKTGLAIGNTLTYLARPLDTIQVNNLAPDWEAIEKSINEWRPDEFLVGLPINLDGTESDFCRTCRKFAGRLKHRFPKKVIFYDEKHSSAQAEDILKNGNIFQTKKVKNFKNKANQKLRDQVAAQVILQRYLDDLSIGKNNAIK